MRRILSGIFYCIDRLPQLFVVGYLALLAAALIRLMLWLLNLA